MDFYKKILDLRIRGCNSQACGWGAEDDENNNNLEKVKYLDHLRCIDVKLHGTKTCSNVMPRGNFRTSLICGEGIYSNQSTTLVISL